MKPPSEDRLISILAAICGFAVSANVAAGKDFAARVLTDADWRTDIEVGAAAIREIHPRPFRTLSEAAFHEQLDALLVDVPKLSDKEVIVRLAALVALIDDGHTRLSIPCHHPSIGLEFGHTRTPGAEHPALGFRQLPLAFEKLDDGIFVNAAREDLKDLIGYRLETIDDTNAEEAFAAVHPITCAENPQLDALMGADRLSLPEVLAVLGITRSGDEVTLALLSPDGVRSQEIVALMDAARFLWNDAYTDRPLQ